MQSFHNDLVVKNKYVSRVAEHMAADNITRGTGWKDGKGCAVGCTLEAYKHERYEIELGLPEWLAYLEDSLFDGMSLEKSKSWPKVFLESIPLGISEKRFECEVKAPFFVLILKRLLETTDLSGYEDVKNYLEGCISLWKRDDIGSIDWESAAGSAWSAVWSAKSAAESAGSAAGSAAESAESAAYDYYADELLRLLKKL